MCRRSSSTYGFRTVTQGWWDGPTKYPEGTVVRTNSAVVPIAYRFAVCNKLSGKSMNEARRTEMVESATRVAEALDSAIMAVEFLDGTICEEMKMASHFTPEEADEKDPQLLALADRIEISVNRLGEMLNGF